jgi:glycerol dehydrogenase
MLISVEANMKKKAVFPGQYHQGQGILSELPEITSIFGGNPLLLASSSVKTKILPVFGTDKIKSSIPNELFRGQCCEDEIERLTHIVTNKKIDVMIGMGGGKTIDTAKIVADRAGIPVIIVPTIASTDAPCSGCAVVYSNDDVFESVQYQKRNPTAVVVDMNIISHAPSRFLVSGMGDALATWFEARSCERTRSLNECGGLSLMTGLHLAKLCYDILLDQGLSAKIANEAHIVTPALESIAEANILLSGVGFESSGLAAAHAIHNGLTALKETHTFFHGEKVAFGVLAGLHLTGAEPKEISQVYSFCESIGLPTTLAEIGLEDVDTDSLFIAASKACEPGQSIHNEAGIITPTMVMHSMIMADALGQARKSPTCAL